MGKDELFRIKTIALKAVFDDDWLRGTLVLKGGNALDLVYDIASRSSLDLDFSMADDIASNSLTDWAHRIRTSLEVAFHKAGYRVFDFCVELRPKKLPSHLADFWGGYRIEFKVIDMNLSTVLAHDLSRMRLQALELGPGNRKALKIDISTHEYCAGKRPRDLEGSTIYVYTPEMVLFEKLRAICQQMPEYRSVVGVSTATGRARDFYDIYTILESFRLDFLSAHNIETLNRVFEAKRVPLPLIALIPKYRDYHQQDFESLRGTFGPAATVRDFDFYFDYVVQRCCEPLHSQGII